MASDKVVNPVKVFYGMYYWKENIPIHLAISQSASSETIHFNPSKNGWFHGSEKKGETTYVIRYFTKDRYTKKIYIRFNIQQLPIIILEMKKKGIKCFDEAANIEEDCLKEEARNNGFTGHGACPCKSCRNWTMQFGEI